MGGLLATELSSTRLCGPDRLDLVLAAVVVQEPDDLVVTVRMDLPDAVLDQAVDDLLDLKTEAPPGPRLRDDAVGHVAVRVDDAARDEPHLGGTVVDVLRVVLEAQINLRKLAVRLHGVTVAMYA